MANSLSKKLHTLFEAGIVIKTLDSIGEIVLGFFFAIASPTTVRTIASMIFGDELRERPHDGIIQFLLHEWNSLSPTGHGFLAFLFLGHGIIKLGLVAGLVRKKIWIYPVAAIAFGAFALYQIYRIIRFPSLLLEVLTTFDIIFIALILHEWKNKKAQAVA